MHGARFAGRDEIGCGSPAGPCRAIASTAFETLRVAVISDTHVPHFARRLPEVVARIAKERPHRIVHCGDLTEFHALTPFEALAPVDAVAGNNDGPAIVARFGRKKIVAIGDCRIGLVHGDGSHGTTLGRARSAFERSDVDAICFGHSHVPYRARHDGVWIVNPGSATDKRRQPRYSYAILEISGATCEPRLVYFD